MAKSRNYGGLIVLLLVLVGGGIGAWYYFNGKTDKEPEFSTTKVNRGDILQAVTATGDLQPVVTVDVGAQVSGQVKDVLVDFNSKVKAGDVLALIDPSTAQQKLRQAQADLESAKANNQLLLITAQRTRDLAKKNLVSQSELDTAEAQLAQSSASLLTRIAAVENSKLDLDHCTITAPIDGIVLNRNTDRGRTVNSSMNAPVLFTLVNDLTKMQINAAVAEADVGVIAEGQDVTFAVDAFPNRTFRGSVRQVRNAATTTSSVVSYATIIDVNNDDLRLKPGMTANVSIIIAQRNNVLRIGNSALRVRIPQDLLPKAPESAKSPAGSATAAPQDPRAVMRAIMTEVGIQRGTPATPEQIEKFKKLAAEKSMDADQIERSVGFMSGGARRNGGQSGDRSTVANAAPRTIYKYVESAPKKIEPATVRLGITDGVNTEIIDGLAENDVAITAVTLPGATALGQPGGAQNPFQQNRGFGPGMGGGGGGGGRGR